MERREGESEVRVRGWLACDSYLERWREGYEEIHGSGIWEVDMACFVGLFTAT